MALGWSSIDRRRKGLRTLLKLFPLALPRLILFVPGVVFAGLPPSAYYLSNIAIFPPYQGKGFGRILLEAVEFEASRLGDSSLVLDVEKRNQKAFAFYLRNGYTPVREFLSFVRMHKGLPQKQAFVLTE